MIGPSDSEMKIRRGRTVQQRGSADRRSDRGRDRHRRLEQRACRHDWFGGAVAGQGRRRRELRRASMQFLLHPEHDREHAAAQRGQRRGRDRPRAAEGPMADGVERKADVAGQPLAVSPARCSLGQRGLRGSTTITFEITSAETLTVMRTVTAPSKAVSDLHAGIPPPTSTTPARPERTPSPPRQQSIASPRARRRAARSRSRLPTDDRTELSPAGRRAGAAISACCSGTTPW